MKNIIKILLSIALPASLFTGCKKEENKVFYEGGTAPVLTLSGNTTQVLTKPNKDVHAVKFSWTNPDYKLNTGVSSHNVIYTLQIDTTGSHFAGSSIDITAVNTDLLLNLTQGELNKLLLPTGLQYGINHDIEFRVKSTLINSTDVPLYSNIIILSITAYLDVAVDIPYEATLWALGSAFASGWDNPLPAPYDVDQKFTRVSETLYELTVNFVGGGNFKLIQKQGEWGSQYRPKYSSNVPFAEGDFERRDADPGWDGPASAGLYKITIDFVTGKYKVEKI